MENNNTGVISEIFNTPASEILDFFIREKMDKNDYDYTIADVDRAVDVSYKTVANEITRLTNLDILKLTRYKGNKPTFKLNDSELCNKLIALFKECLKQKMAQHGVANRLDSC